MTGRILVLIYAYVDLCLRDSATPTANTTHTKAGEKDDMIIVFLGGVECGLRRHRRSTELRLIY